MTPDMEYEAYGWAEEYFAHFRMVVVKNSDGRVISRVEIDGSTIEATPLELVISNEIEPVPEYLV